MSYIIVNAAAELDALNAVVARAKSLLDTASKARFDGRRRELAALLESNDSDEFKFGLPQDKPIQTIASREHKGFNDDANAVSALVTFEWTLRRIPGKRDLFGIRKGGVNVSFLGSDGTLLRSFHYDACRGGVDENGGCAYHPFAHFQYKDGKFADLPRLPTLVFTPADVLEQVLIDLWPRQWPALASSLQSRAALAKHHSGQKKRLEVAATRYIQIAKASSLPLRGLQARLTKDLVI